MTAQPELALGAGGTIHGSGSPEIRSERPRSKSWISRLTSVSRTLNEIASPETHPAAEPLCLAHIFPADPSPGRTGGYHKIRDANFHAF